MSVDDGEELPCAGDTFELVFAVIDEVESGTDDEVNDGAGHEHLVRGRERRDALGEVHPESGDVVAASFDLAGVHAGADPEPEPVDVVADREGALDGA